MSAHVRSDDPLFLPVRIKIVYRIVLNCVKTIENEWSKTSS